MFLKTNTFPSWDLIGCTTKSKLSQLTFVKNAHEFHSISFGQWLQDKKQKPRNLGERLKHMGRLSLDV